ncbi:MAG: sigma-70 family RNA polymerase sigma factor [Planctomycetaceae bacterium]|nr:sigma-70 family RNA polymerase sigma factor [Planctomycetaceae bacterium]MDG1808113.1 sigma-70 family RNA polymerase sigma factor [Pirellulaceae bacterium]MDG2103890.1 sigma-70 family RNA polymerase sigma factor [Pirellulaceae bacterium]
MADDLKRLVTRCLAGQTSAQIDFVNRFQGPVFGFCMRMLRQWEDAEDCTQETMIRVMRNLHRWDPTRKFEPWLYTIAGNRCRTRISKRGKRPSSVTLEVPVEDRSQLYRDADLLNEEIEFVLEELRLQYRNAFTLFHRHELSYEEIGEMMGVPLGTVKTWVHRARRELVSGLAKRGVVEESKSELRPIRRKSPVASR